MAAMFGELFGTLCGTFLLSKLVYKILKKIRPSITTTQIALFVPILFFGLGIWGAHPDIGFYLYKTLAVILGGILFFNTEQEYKQNPKKLIQHSLILASLLLMTYSFFGVETHFTANVESAIRGCSKTFTKMTGISDKEELRNYCGCVTADMFPANCKSTSLLFYNSANECAQNFLSKVSTPEGAVKLSQLQDGCIDLHLSSQKKFVHSKLLEQLRVAQVQEFLRDDELKKWNISLVRKTAFAECIFDSVIATCEDKSLTGYNKCLSNDSLPKEEINNCATKAGKI